MQTTNIGDHKLCYVDQGTGPVILLVHGFPLDHSMWVGQIEALAATHRVIAPDLRGFGQSDVTAGTVTMQQFADDLAALLDALAITDPVTYCGLSMGGYIGWQFFQHHRQRLAKLIQCDTKAQADTDDAQATRLKAADQVLEKGPGALIATMMPKLFAEATIDNDAPIVQATRTVMLNTSPAAIAAALRGMAERPDVTSLLEKIDVPTLIICGEQDAISPAAEMRDIAATIPGAQFAQLDGAGHMSPLEKPAVFNAAVVKFLDT